MADLENELCAQVRDALASEKALNIIGGGSKSFMGRPIKGAPLNTGEHSGIISYEPTELVVTARAGTPITEIETALAENGQCLPFEPPNFDGKATLGGTLAANLSGPARPWRGSIRDSVLGISLINGRGDLLKFGGQVMKNVAGYDVSRLQAGAMGTLGVITQVSLKILPKPATQLTLVREMRIEAALDWMNQLAAKPIPLSGMCWVDGKTYIRLEGAQRSIEAMLPKLEATPLTAGREFWASLCEQRLDFFADREPLWRLSIDSAAAHKKSGWNWLIDWGGAQRWVKGEHAKKAMESEASRMQGHLSLYRGGNRSGEVLHDPPEPVKKLQANLKKAFDPKGILNPGRLYGWM